MQLSVGSLQNEMSPERDLKVRSYRLNANQFCFIPSTSSLLLT